MPPVPGPILLRVGRESPVRQVLLVVRICDIVPIRAQDAVGKATLRLLAAMESAAAALFSAASCS